MKKEGILLKIIMISLLILVINGCAFSNQSTHPKAPTNLRIQDNTEQIGIETNNPRFAWYVNDCDRGEIQTAYRILVASSQENIDANIGDLWDSGKVISSKQYGVKYAGSALESNTKYWWKLTTWDREDKQSPWSNSKTFITAFLNPVEWTANWIKSSNNTTSVPYMLRKQFDINKTINYATANVCGVGQFELHLNGQKVGDHELDPGWTVYSKSQQYVVFEVTSLLQKGNNAIGVWLADGWMDLGNSSDRFSGYTKYSVGEKRMIMELNIFYTDGTSEKIISDDTWKTSNGPITYSHVFGGEDYDARLEKHGWDLPGYNDVSWEDAVITKSPGGTLNTQSQPPVKVIETLKPTIMTQNADTVNVIFDKTYAGVFDIAVSGEAGQTIEITMDDGTPIPNAAKVYCRYTLKGDEIEVFRPKFFYWGQNKITVRNASLSNKNNVPKIHDINGYVLSCSANPVGVFNSSDSVYNSIFSINKQGILSNMYSCITDCPHREKAGWMNDIHFTSPSFSALFDMHTLYSKINKDITESQQEEGWIPGMSPFYRDPLDPNNPFYRSPFFDIASMSFPMIMYQQYGDTETLINQYDVAKNSLAHLTSQSSGYLVGYGLGDWLDPDPVSTEFIETCVYYDFVNSMKKWASILNKADDVNNYNKLAINIKNAFNAKYFNESTHSYGSQQTANTVPLYHGMCPDGEEGNVLKALISSIENSGYTINCGQNAHGYMLQVLSKHGRDDIVGRMHMNNKGPSFAHWISLGKTNTPERWDGGPGSEQHHMNNVFPEWVCKNLAGISNLKPGYEQIIIRPTSATSYVPKTVSYSLQTIRGIITSNWSKNDNYYFLNVTIPVNSTAKVYIPTFGMSDITISESKTVLWENGSAVKDLRELSYHDLDGEYPSPENYVIFNVGSGDYLFKSEW